MDNIIGLLGLRAMVRTPEGIYVSPSYDGFSWPKIGVVDAVCLKCETPASRLDCGCGIYATTDFDKVLRTYTMGRDNAPVFLVEGSGSIVWEERGWHAQTAAVLAVVNMNPTKNYGYETDMKGGRLRNRDLELVQACEFFERQLISAEQAQWAVEQAWKKQKLPWPYNKDGKYIGYEKLGGKFSSW